MSERLVYGLHAVKALLMQPKTLAKKLYLGLERGDQRINDILQLAQQLSLPIEKLSNKKMSERFADCPHQGVVASAFDRPSLGEGDIAGLVQACQKNCLILILDGITDPHNLGACLRSAEAAGVDFVIIPKDKSANLSATVTKVSSGASEIIPLVRVTNLARTMLNLKQLGVWIYGAAGDASSSLFQQDLRPSVALVMGAEGQGMRRLTKDHCDGLFSIPMHGAVESLNVSVAAGICLYEALRQRI